MSENESTGPQFGFYPKRISNDDDWFTGDSPFSSPEALTIALFEAAGLPGDYQLSLNAEQEDYDEEGVDFTEELAPTGTAPTRLTPLQIRQAQGKVTASNLIHERIKTNLPLNVIRSHNQDGWSITIQKINSDERIRLQALYLAGKIRATLAQETFEYALGAIKYTEF